MYTKYQPQYSNQYQNNVNSSYSNHPSIQNYFYDQLSQKPNYNIGNSYNNYNQSQLLGNDDYTPDTNFGDNQNINYEINHSYSGYDQIYQNQKLEQIPATSKPLQDNMDNIGAPFSKINSIDNQTLQDTYFYSYKDGIESNQQNQTTNVFVSNFNNLENLNKDQSQNIIESAEIIPNGKIEATQNLNHISEITEISNDNYTKNLFKKSQENRNHKQIYLKEDDYVDKIIIYKRDNIDFNNSNNDYENSILIQKKEENQIIDNPILEQPNNFDLKKYSLLFTMKESDKSIIYKKIQKKNRKKKLPKSEKDLKITNSLDQKKLKNIIKRKIPIGNIDKNKNEEIGKNEKKIIRKYKNVLKRKYFLSKDNLDSKN